MKISQALRQLEPLLCLLCPPECAWCGVPVHPENSFCEECRCALQSNYYQCQRCATPLPTVVPNDGCFRCRDSGWKFARVATLGPYRGKLREAVILTKKRSYETLRIGLAQLMAQSMEAKVAGSRGGDSPVIIPVPNHWSHTFSQAASTANSLAFAIAKKTGFPVKTSIVRRVRKTAKQGMLSWTERKQNVRGAFEIKHAKSLIERHVWLVDDVLTSGATASELSSCFLRAGAKEVSVIVIARGTGTRDHSQLANPMESNVKN